jgi:hypothetical protein
MKNHHPRQKTFVWADYLTNITFSHLAVIFGNERDMEAFNKAVLKGGQEGCC